MDAKGKKEIQLNIREDSYRRGAAGGGGEGKSRAMHPLLSVQELYQGHE